MHRPLASRPRRAEGSPHRRLVAGLVWALLLGGLSQVACAQDVAREFADWLPPEPPRTRTPSVLRSEWERLQRAPDRFAPPVASAANLALLAAARAGRWNDVMSLLKSGEARARSADTSSANVLELAVLAGEADVLRELLSRGADLDRIADSGFTPLGAAAFQGQASVVRQLARAGADLQRWGTTGQAPLHLASLAGRTSMVAVLLSLHVDLEGLNRARETAIDVAAAHGRAEVLDLLLAAGADTRLAGRR